MYRLLVSAFLLVSLYDGVQCWLNSYDSHLEFECPAGQYIYKWESQHSNKKEDRQWNYKCRAGLVGNECRWGGLANNWDANMDYNCPKDHVLAGAKSDHDNHREDRRWYYKCCRINTKSGASCYTTSSINEMDKYMSYQVPTGRAITGVKSQHSNKKEDRVWQLKLCTFSLCVGTSIKILDNVPAVVSGKQVVGIATSQGCSSGQTYNVNLRSTESVTETNGITVTNGQSFTFSTTISVSATAKAGFLGSGVSLTMGVSQSFGGSTSFAKSEAKSTATSSGSWAAHSIDYTGPGAAIVIGEVTKYKIDRDHINVRVHVQCDDGTSFDNDTRMSLTSTTYGQTHFTNAIGKFNSGKCTSRSNDCLRSVEGARALAPETVVDSFSRCFASGVGTVSKK